MNEGVISHNNNFNNSSRLISLCLKANQYALEDPEVSLTQARKAAEAICLHIFSQEIGEPGKLMLNDLIKHLGDRKILPRRLQLPLSTIQSYGNYGSHHQDDCVEVDTEFVEPCLSALRQVLNWFFTKYLDNEVPEELSGFVRCIPNQSTEPKASVNYGFVQKARPNLFSGSNSGSNFDSDVNLAPTKSISHLPVNDLMPILRDGNALTLNCPCDLTMTFKANQMTMAFYGNEVVPFERYEQWWNKNPQILACLTTADGEVQGYFDVFPLKDMFLDEFIEGKLKEDDLEADHILSAGESIFCCQLYLGGIAVRSPNTFVGSRNATILLWGLLRYLKAFYPGNRARMLYALGSTAEGEALLKKFNFTMMSPAKKRADQHNFYVLPFTPLLLDNYLSLIQDWSGNCKISWNKEGSNAIKSLAS